MENDLIPRSAAIEAMLKQKTPTPSVIRRVLRQVPGVDATPCDLCRFSPPSSMDGKPCTMCVAEGGE